MCHDVYKIQVQNTALHVSSIERIRLYAVGDLESWSNSDILETITLTTWRTTVTAW
jgi:hypothetical protein